MAPGTYQFGYRVAIHDAIAVVGGEGSSRSAHVFVRGAGNTWERQAVLKKARIMNPLDPVVLLVYIVALQS